MIPHPKMKEWDDTLKKMFDEIDDFLEDKYGTDFPLHPNRMKRGMTSNKEMDGLFNIGASYSTGYGSSTGKSYVIDIHLSTLSHIPDNIRKKIENDVILEIKTRLPRLFPDRKLDVVRDRHMLKIVGDFSLGYL